MSVPCLFALEFGVLEFWLCRSVLKHSINKRNQSQGLPIDISVQLQACFSSYKPDWRRKPDDDQWLIRSVLRRG